MSFSYDIFTKKRLFYQFQGGKTKFHHFWPPWTNPYACIWKNPLLPLPWKKFAQRPCLHSEIASPKESVTRALVAPYRERSNKSSSRNQLLLLLALTEAMLASRELWRSYCLSRAKLISTTLASHERSLPDALLIVSFVQTREFGRPEHCTKVRCRSRTTGHERSRNLSRFRRRLRNPSTQSLLRHA